MANLDVTSGKIVATRIVTTGESGSFTFTRMYPAYVVSNYTTDNIYVSDVAIDSSDTGAENVMMVPKDARRAVQFKGVKVLYTYSVAAGTIEVVASNNLLAIGLA